MKQSLLNFIKIDKRQSSPIHLQIVHAIKQLATDRKMNYLDELPSIDELSQTLKVRSDEVRNAYQKLLIENFIRFDDEKYYVNYINFSSDYYIKVSRLYEIILDLGLTPSIKTIKKKITSLPIHLAVDPRIDPNESYVLLKRIYYGNDIPLALMDIYLPQATYQGIEKMPIDDKPLYEAIFASYQKMISSGRRLMSVVNLSRDDAKHLNAVRDVASYQVVSVSFDQHKNLIDITRSISTMNQYFEVEFDEHDIERITKNHFYYI